MKMTFPALIDSLHSILSWVLDNIPKDRFNEKTLKEIELAIEEAVVNIIQHGYQCSTGNIDVECILSGSAGVKITLRDQAIPHNPLLSAQNLDPTLERTSGHGIRLILSLMDNVSYVREFNENILTMSKRYDCVKVWDS